MPSVGPSVVITSTSEGLEISPAAKGRDAEAAHSVAGSGKSLRPHERGCVGPVLRRAEPTSHDSRQICCAVAGEPGHEASGQERKISGWIFEVTIANSSAFALAEFSLGGDDVLRLVICI